MPGNVRFVPVAAGRIKLNAPTHSRYITAAPLPDVRLQLWGIDEAGQMWSSWETRGPNSNWTYWSPFQMLPNRAFVMFAVAAPLSDGRL